LSEGLGSGVSSSSGSPANHTEAARGGSASPLSSGAASLSRRDRPAGSLDTAGSEGGRVAGGATAAAAAAARVVSIQPVQAAGAVRRRGMLPGVALLSFRPDTCRCTATAAAPASSQMAANVSGGAGEA
jgi:hypothetical protein